MISETVKLYCCEDVSQIENFEKANTDKENVWCCHHRLESHTFDGEFRTEFLSSRELISLGLYYCRPVKELIFLTKQEHKALHNKDSRKRKKASAKLKGRKNESYSQEMLEAAKELSFLKWRDKYGCSNTLYYKLKGM